MVQIGEFSFIVATLGMSLGVISDFLYPVIVCVSVFDFIYDTYLYKNFREGLQLHKQADAGKIKSFHTKEHFRKSKWMRIKTETGLDYIKGVIIRTAISSMAMFITYLAGIRYIEPFLSGYIDSETACSIISAVVIIIFMIPFASADARTQEHSAHV